MSVLSSNCSHFETWADGTPIELVYFCFPGCDGRCRHCWSSGTFLGRNVPPDWHCDFWRNVDGSRLSSIKISGGETFLYRDLPRLVQLIREHVGYGVKIKLLTSGRPFVSLSIGQTGVDETLAAMVGMDLPLRNLEIHLSADEHHALPWIRTYSRRTSTRSFFPTAESLLTTAVSNFLGACARLKADEPSFGGRLKIHAGRGRLAWHRQFLYPWIDDTQWESFVDCSEGLVDTGRASETGTGDYFLHSGTARSLFIIPGTTFDDAPSSRHSQRYSACGDNSGAFLNASRHKGDGTCVLGWWNLVNKRFCGGTITHALHLVGRS